MSSPHSLERRLVGYALAAGAAIAATQTAKAAIDYTDLDPDLVFTFGTGPQNYLIDLDGDLTDDFNLLFFTSAWTSTTGGIHVDNYYRSVRVAPSGGNRVLCTSTDTARALNSNYAISPGASSWQNGVGWMAWQGSDIYSTGYVDPYSGGYFLGKNHKMLGLSFDIGGNTHYGWCRVSVDKNVRQFIVHDYAYEDVADTAIPAGAHLEPVLEGTVGNLVPLAAADVPGAGANFACCPKVLGYYFDPIKGKKTAKTSFKGTLNGDSSSVVLDVKKKVKLYDSKAFKTAYKYGNTCRDFLMAQPNQGMFFDLQVTLADKTVVPGVAHLALLPPQITGTVGTTNPGDVVTIDGDWFGVKPPKVWLEYLVDKCGANCIKTLKLKVLKPYAFPDAKGKPNASCMNVNDGTSQLQVQLPDAWPDNFDDISATHYLVIDNGIGLTPWLLLP